VAEEAERSGPPVGSVAEETARLLDALLAGADAAPTGRAHRAPEVDAEPVGDACPTCGHAPGASHTAASGEACHLCPVCQLLRVVRTVRPETLDRLADLAAAVTETLRDSAASRWRETGSPPPRRARPEVEEIPIEEEEAAR
jgi:hypothetical protein